MENSRRLFISYTTIVKIAKNNNPRREAGNYALLRGLFFVLPPAILGSNQVLKELGVTYFVDLHPIFYLAGTGSRMEATIKV